MLTISASSPVSRKSLAAVVSFLLAAAVFLAAPLAAEASFSNTLAVNTSSSAAAAHPDLTLTTTLTPTPDIQSLELTMPQGLQIAPGAIAQRCTLTAAASGSCAPSSKIGTVEISRASGGDATGELFMSDAPSSTYAAGVAVRVDLPGEEHLIFQGGLKLRSEGGNQPVHSLTFSSIPTAGSNSTAISLTSIELTFEGIPAAAALPLVTNPSNCPSTARTITSSATATTSATAATSASYAVTGCSSLSFTPTFEQMFETPEADAMSRGTFEVNLPLSHSSVKSIVLKLPPFVGMNYPAWGAAADRCPGSSLSNTSAPIFDPSSCPTQARVGTVTVDSPLLPVPISGALYIVNKTPLPALGIALSYGGVVMNIGVWQSWPYVNPSCDPNLDWCEQQMQLSLFSLPEIPITRFQIVNQQSGRVSSTSVPMYDELFQMVGDASPQCVTPQDAHAYVTPWSTTTATHLTDPVGLTGCVGSGDPPTTTITSAPAAISTDNTPSVSFSSADSGATFQCKLDAAAYTSCTSTHTYSTAIADGEHKIKVRAVNSAGPDQSPAVATFTVDTTAPDVPNLTSTPGALTDSIDTEFEFTGEASADFECKLDAGSYAACTSPYSDELDQGDHEFFVRQTDEAGNVSAAATFEWKIVDPAPPLPQDVQTPFVDQISFLYDGEHPRQSGVDEEDIDPNRVTVLKGRVTDRDGDPLTGVTIVVPDHEEYGTTLTDEDGSYFMAVNGGGTLSIRATKDGYLPAERTLPTNWREYGEMADIALTEYDEKSSEIEFGALTPDMQVARGSLEVDGDGSRRATLLVEPGTTATAHLPDTSTVALDDASIRATEVTVGEDGREAMPGELPSSSAYTYAVDYSIDEARAVDAESVSFNKPVISYTDNFLEFPNGEPVPAGYYDKDTHAWVAEDSGIVLKVVGVSSGKAQVSIVSNDAVANSTTLDGLGITDDELEKLATLYVPGQSLWRVRLSHFSFWDFNWGMFLPPGANPWGSDDSDNSGGCEAFQFSSIIGCDFQSLGERIDLPGTDFNLNYTTKNKKGFEVADELEFSLTGDDPDESLDGVTVQVSVAGQLIKQDFGAAANASAKIKWNHKDAFGRRIAGPVAASLRVGYRYNASYQSTDRFGYYGNGAIITASAMARPMITMWRTDRATVGTPRNADIGGWSIDVHHSYDPETSRLFMGNGTDRDVKGTIPEIQPFAGAKTSSDPSASTADGVDAVDALLSTGSVGYNGAMDIAALPNGDLAILIPGGRVRKVTPDGKIYTLFDKTNVASNFSWFTDISDIAAGPDGAIYMTGARRVVKYLPNGTFELVAGNGSYADPFGARSENTEATATAVTDPQRVTVGKDLNVYFWEGARIRRVEPGGLISTVVGDGTLASTPTAVGGQAKNWQFKDYSRGIAAGPDGSVYFDDGSFRLIRVNNNGQTELFAGTGVQPGDPEPDGLLATETPIGDIRSMEFAPNGDLVIADVAGTVRGYGEVSVARIGQDGLVRRYTTAEPGATPDTKEAAATSSAGGFPMVTVGPSGAVYFGNIGSASEYGRVHRIKPQNAEDPSAAYRVPSADGSEVYTFDAAGRHLTTRNANTGAALYTFGYDTSGRLTTISDGDSNVTEIERDGYGNPTAIVGPFGKTTEIEVDGQGRLETATQPDGGEFGATYDSGDLLTTFEQPNGGTNTFEYETDGRLKSDEDALNSAKTLSRTRTYVEHTGIGDRSVRTDSEFETAGGKVTTITRVEQPDGTLLRTTEMPDGTLRSSSLQPSGSSSAAGADGTQLQRLPGADPRFGTAAPLVSSASMETPGEKTLTVTNQRTVTGLNRSDPFDFDTLQEVLTVNGEAYTTIFDKAVNTYTETSPEGRESVTTVDSQNRPVLDEVPGFEDTAYSYDSHGRLDGISQGDREMSVEYGTDGEVEAFTDSMGRETSYTRDANGRVTSETLPGGRTIEYAYDENGNMTSVSPPSRPDHSTTFNLLNLVTSFAPPQVGSEPVTTTYDYDTPDHELTEITRPSGRTIEFSYDSAGRANEVETADGTETTTFDDETGRVESIESMDGETTEFEFDGPLVLSAERPGLTSASVEFGYDGNLRLNELTVSGASTAYGYDDDSLLTQAGDLSITRNATNGVPLETDLGGVHTEMSYNGYGDPTEVSTTYPGSGEYTEAYTRDKLSRVTSKTVTTAAGTDTFEYVYDTAGRLTTVEKNNAQVEAYTYDSNSNRTSATYGTGGSAVNKTATFDDRDRMMSLGDLDLSYNADGELTQKEDTSSSDVTSYEYSTLGKLKSVTLPDSTEVSYLYDGLGNRVVRKVDGDIDRRFVYAPGSLTPSAELDASGDLVSRFVNSVGGTPAYMVRGGATYRLITDQVGSVRLVVNSSTGAIAQAIEYDAFGQVVSDSNPGFQPFGFAGGLYDADTGLTHFGFREYDAELGRWTSSDPVRFGGGDANLYGYVMSDPVNLVDPWGRDWIDTAAQTFMGAADEASGGVTSDIRDMVGLGDQAHKDSTAYKAGEWAARVAPWGWGFKNTARAAREFYKWRKAIPMTRKDWEDLYAVAKWDQLRTGLRDLGTALWACWFHHYVADPPRGWPVQM